MTARKKLPIGIQTFAKMRQGDYYYVDKTAMIKDMIDNGTHYFLSRPRRFGKSLLLDTIKELFEGNEELFRGWRSTSIGTGQRCFRYYVSASALVTSGRLITCNTTSALSWISWNSNST